MRYAFKRNNIHIRVINIAITYFEMQVYRVICNMNAQDEDVFL